MMSLNTQTAFLARQPIYDRQLRVFAYELLFRADSSDQANVPDGDQATSDVITSALMDIGLDNIVGPHLAFINMTRAFLTGALPAPLVKERVVLEVLEDIAPDDELISAVVHLVQEGFEVALDDFVYRPEFDPLLKIAKIVKLDVLALDPKQLEADVSLLRDFDVMLLAEKVETYDDYKRCHAMGFDYFQGYFFCKPDILTGKRPDINRLVILELMAKLQDPNADAEVLEAIIIQDASLAYRLLRYMNSAFFALRSECKSMKHAITLMGSDTVKNLASLILMTHVGNEKPHELLVTGMIRGKMCELLGQADTKKSPEEYFTAGLFSILDALLDMPLPDVIESLPLGEDLKAALQDYSGPLGVTLKHVLDHQEGQCSGAPFTHTEQAYACQNAYIDAIKWADESWQTMFQ